MVSYSKKILLVLISLIVGIIDYAQGAENRNQNPRFHELMENRLLLEMLYGNSNRYGGPEYDESPPKEIPQIEFIPPFPGLERFKKDPISEIKNWSIFKPEHLVWAIVFDKKEALDYLLHTHPEALQSRDKILRSLGFASGYYFKENDYKKAFSRIFNDFVKDKPLFMDSPKLVIKLFILSAEMGDAEAFVYLKNRIEKLNLTPDGRKFIYFKAYDFLTRSNPELAQQFLAEDIAQLS